ncbi:MAG: hypothetical protein JNG88_09115 [Phycisphaerales bacterium]|nr:hypothetical protein [Phycisphaerales bacterium]
MNRQPRDKNEPISGRESAVRAVRAAYDRHRYVGDVLAALRSQHRLAPREHGLAMEIALGTMRHTVTLEHVLCTLAKYEPGRSSLATRAILNSAVYQAAWTDRIPLPAIVDESVDLARLLVSDGAARLVNALLRRVCDAIVERRTAFIPRDPSQLRVSWHQACKFRTAILPDPNDDPDAYVAVAAGEIPARYHKLVTRFGRESAEQIVWASQALPPTVLWPNTLRTDVETFQERVKQEIDADAAFVGDAAVVVPGARIGEASLLHEGLAYVQDGTSHFAAEFAAAQPGERVVDLCAAPGGKAITMALSMRDKGELAACDISEERMRRAVSNFAKLGLSCVRCVPLEAHLPPPLEKDAYDVVLADVPCSNSGVIARRPEARFDQNERKSYWLQDTQLRLLGYAADLTRSGGRLIYSTCSIDREENEDIVAEFLSKDSRYRLDTENTRLPNWGPEPGNWQDGGYVARLIRS